MSFVLGDLIHVQRALTPAMLPTRQLLRLAKVEIPVIITSARHRNMGHVLGDETHKSLTADPHAVAWF